MGFYGDLENKRDCISCRYYSLLWGCGKGKLPGRMNASTCSYFENKYKYKEQLKKEKETENERKKLEDENEILRKENDELRNTQSSDILDDYSDIDFNNSDYEDDDDSLSEEEIKEKVDNLTVSLIDDISKNSNSVINQLKEMRNEDLAEKVISISGLDDYIKFLVDSEETINKSKEFLTKFSSKNITKIDYQISTFYKFLSSEIKFYNEKELFNVSFALAKSFSLSRTSESKSIFKECEKKFINYSLKTAKKFIAQSNYEDAIEFLAPLSNNKDVKDLLNKCYEEEDKKIVNDAKILMSKSKYKEALDVLTKTVLIDKGELVKECKLKIDDSEIERAKFLWKSKKRKEAINCLDSISDCKKATDLKTKYIKANKKRRTLIVLSISFASVIAVVIGVVVGVNVSKNNKARIISECQTSLIGKTFYGSGNKDGSSINVERTFVFGDTRVHVTGKTVDKYGTYTVDENFAYYCEWGPGNYPEYSSTNNMVNIYMNSTTSSLSWRYLAYYDEIDGCYTVTSFSYRSEPYYKIIK